METKKENNKILPVPPPVAGAVRSLRWRQIIEWASIVLVVGILAGGGIFFIYPAYKKIEALPAKIKEEKDKYEKRLEDYQKTAQILEAYRSALSNSPQELTLIGRAFWKNATETELLQSLDEPAKNSGVVLSNVKPRNDLRPSLPEMVVYDIDVNGSANAQSAFKQLLEINLPLVWFISETTVSDDARKLTVSLLKEPANAGLEAAKTGFASDLYSLPKFRIIKESVDN